MLEAECTRCTETFIPQGLTPWELIHGETEAGKECGGIGIIQGEWLRKEDKTTLTGQLLTRGMQQFETHGRKDPNCEDPYCVYHHPEEQ